MRFEKEDALPSIVKPPISREQLRLYAEASQDNNPIHLDEEVARKVGLPGVIAHGMITMAFMGEFVQQALDSLEWKRGRIAELNCRFKSMTYPGDVITITGTVTEATLELLACDISAHNQRGELTATGHAVLRSR